MTKTEKKPVVMVTAQLPVTEDRIKNLLVSAFEGGIGYWGRIMKYTYPPGYTSKDFDDWHKTNRWENPRYVEVPMMEGGKVWLHDAEEPDSHWKEISEEEREKWCLTREKIIKGMQIFASLKPGEGGYHFPNFMNENDDAETADVFVQCCLFGEIVYG